MADEHAEEPDFLKEPPSFFPYMQGELPDGHEELNRELVEVQFDHTIRGPILAQGTRLDRTGWHRRKPERERHGACRKGNVHRAIVADARTRVDSCVHQVACARHAPAQAG